MHHSSSHFEAIYHLDYRLKYSRSLEPKSWRMEYDLQAVSCAPVCDVEGNTHARSLYWYVLKVYDMYCFVSLFYTLCEWNGGALVRSCSDGQDECIDTNLRFVSGAAPNVWTQHLEVCRLWAAGMTSLNCTDLHCYVEVCGVSLDLKTATTVFEVCVDLHTPSCECWFILVRLRLVGLGLNSVGEIVFSQRSIHILLLFFSCIN